MSRPRLLVVNPNSNATVTAGIDRSLDAQRDSLGLAIDCETTPEGPYGIESDDDVKSAASLVRLRVAEAADEYDAFVIACYSDPGVAACRGMTARPVLGIQESAAMLCAAHGRRFGVLALSRESIVRHIARVRELGLQNFHAGERPLGITVEQSASDPATLDKIVATGKELIEEDGAEMLVLGCAGMVGHRDAAQSALGVPVIDPVQAGVEMANRLLAEAG